MVLECADGPFRCIAAVDMGWHQLIVAVVVHNGLAEGGATFIVHDVQSGWVSGLAQSGV